MTLHSGLSRCVNAYHHNNSLLFQFVLSEFLEAFAEIQKLDILCNRKPATSKYASMFQNKEDILDQIEGCLTKLVGSTREYMRLFSWNFSEGLLAKLKTYCTLLLQNVESDEKDLLALQHYTDKVWQGCVHALDFFRDKHKNTIDFNAATEKASASMHRLAKLIARFIPQFKDDENVLFFILRHKEYIDVLYGSRFVAKLLSRTYPKGLREVHHFLHKRYQERGFENILPIIATKIAELESSST